MNERSEAASTREQDDNRTPFERFVEVTHHKASQAPFFIVCVAVVIAWLVSLPLWVDLKAWQVAIHTVASVFTLLLVVLMENASRRSDEASAEKINVIAEALAALMRSRSQHDEELAMAERKLREAVGLEERH